MEGGGSAAVRATPRRKEGAGAVRGGGPRVSARVRAPHGAGAVLLVLGGAVAGAAFLAWRRACRGRASGGGEDGGGKDHREIKPVEEEVSDGGVAEDEQNGVSARNLDQLDENLSRNSIDVATNGLDGKVTEELIHIQKDDEIAPDELANEPVGNFDQNLSRNCAEITADDMDTESVTKVDENSGNDSINNEVTPNVLDTEGVDNSDESTLSISYPDIAQEDHNNHNYDSDEHDNRNDGAHETASTETAPVTQVLLNEEQFSEEVEVATVAETEQVELSERTTMENNEFEQEEDNEFEQEEGNDEFEQEEGNEFEQEEGNEFEQEEGNEFEQEEHNKFEQEEEKQNELEQDEQKKDQFEQEDEKPLIEPAELVGSPEYSSLPCLLKPTEKKGPVNPRWSETGMKLDQDYTNGELEKHELTKGGADHGVAVLAMDRKPTYMAVLALIFAVAIGITIAMRLYVPSQQHDLQVDLQ